MIEAINELNRFTDEYQHWLIAGFFVALVLVIVVGQLIGRSKTHLHGNAKLASSFRVWWSGLYGKKGIVLGIFKGRILRLGGSSHCALVAPTRSDKGVSVGTPTCMAWHESMVANDTKDELFYQTSKLRESYGHKVWKWAPYSLTTHRFNPLDLVSDDPMHLVESIQSIAYIIYPRRENETMWIGNARALFISLVMLVKESDDRPSTIGEVFRVSQGYGESTPNYLMKIIRKRNYDAVVSVDDKGNETVEYVKKPPYNGEGVPPLSDSCVAGLMTHINAPVETSGGILTNMQAPLQIWASEIVDAATSKSDFDIRTFRQEPQTLFLHIPQQKQEQGDFLISLFYTLFINENMDEVTGAKYPLKTLMLMDEFGSTRIPAFEKKIGAMAGFGLICLLIFQNKGQIERSTFDGGYGVSGANTLLGNCHAKVFFTPDVEDSESISKMIGTITFKAKSRQLGRPMQGQESDQRRDLIMPQELRDMSQKLMLIKIRGCPIIRCRKIVWYKYPALRNRLWNISKALYGNKSPTELQIQNAGSELRSHVPTIDAKKWMAAKADRQQSMSMSEKETVIVAATHMDVVKGLNLNDIVVADTEFPEGTSTQEQIDGYLDAFFAVETEDGEPVDTETGEVIAKTVSITKTVDITGELDAA